ncbi:hypothetical protein R6Q59_013447 [Mikania micrantha]
MGDTKYMTPEQLKRHQLLTAQQKYYLDHHNPNEAHQHYLLLKQKEQHQQQQKLQQAISRFPSNIDAHLRPLQRPIANQQQQNPSTNLLENPNPMSLNSQLRPPNRTQTHPTASPPANQVELQMAYQDAWRVCRPDFKRPFLSLEDACERLLPYHVVADYEVEEDDRILDSDTTGQVLSRTQQWDQSIANKVSEFTATFEKQVLAFNIISRRRAIGEFRSEERVLIEQALLREERRSLLEARAEMEKQQKANMRMAAMEQSRSEMMDWGPIRGSAMGEQEQGVNPDDTMIGWNNNGNDNNNNNEKEPSEDFLNDEERENGDAGVQSDWREGAEFDLNTR